MIPADRPSEDIWLNQEALSAHFDRVEHKYSSDSDSAGVESIPADLDQNELTRGLRG